MKIGVPKEIKPQENRIGLTPESVKTLVGEGHEVLVENNGGFEAGFDNDQYIKAGAKIVKNAEDIFNDSEIIVKVKFKLSNNLKPDTIKITNTNIVNSKYMIKILVVTLLRLGERLVCFSRLKVKSKSLKLNCLFENTRIRIVKK